MRRTLIGLLVLAAAAGTAFADLPAVEEAIERQDELLKTDKVALVDQARAAVEVSNTPANRYLLGRALGLAGKFDEARDQFQRAIEADPSFAYAYHGLAVYHLVNRAPLEAEQQLLQAISLDGKLTRARLDLARILSARDDRLAAERQFQAVLAYDPENTEVRMLFANQFLRERRFDRAIDELRILLAKDPENVAARKLHAVALTFHDKKDQAAAEFERVIAAQPKDYESYVFLKNLRLDLGDSKGAIGALEKLLSVLPEEAKERPEIEKEIQRIRDGGGPVARPRTALETLLAELESEDPARRRAAMRMLCEAPFERIPTEMLRRVTDPDEEVRALVVRKLGQVTPWNGLGLLEVLLFHPKDRDEKESVRAAAAEGIAANSRPGIAPLLLAALSDPSPRVFQIAVQGLREITGVYFTEGPTDFVPADKREEFAAKWRAWWAGPRAFALKLDAIEELEANAFPRAPLYVADLIGDAEPAVAKAAFEAFTRLTGKAPGAAADLGTPEGREKLRTAAVAAANR